MKPTPENGAIRLVFVGDIALGESPSSAGLGISRARGDALYSQWREYLANFSADYILGNLECTVSNSSEYSADHIMNESMRTDPVSAGPMGNSGISHLSLANNHVNDHGWRAYRDTKDYLRSQNIVAIEHFPRAGVIRRVSGNGISIGIIALNFVNKSMGRVDDTISIASEELAPLMKLIGEERQRVDHLIVTVHWGENYGLWPTDLQTALARDFAKSGVSAIIGHHPHNIQDTRKIENVPVVYSLGSFCFENKSPFTRLGQIVVLDCSRRSLTIADHRFISIDDNFMISEHVTLLQRILMFLIRKRPSAILNFAFVRTVRIWIFCVSLFRTVSKGNVAAYIKWIKHRYAKTTK